MFLISKTRPAGPTEVYFAFELASVCPMRTDITVLQAIMHAARLVAPLHNVETDTAYELVAQSRCAGSAAPSLTLRVRVSHHDGPTALARARQTAEGLGTALTLWNMHRWEPVNEARYKMLYDSFTPVSIWEMSRRTELAEFPAGLRTGAAGRHNLVIAPFAPQPTPFTRVLEILDRCKERTLFSVAIAPTRLTEKEIKYMAVQHRAAEYEAENELDSLLMPGNDIKSLSAPSNDNHGESYFLLRIYAASAAALPSITINSIACAAGGPVMAGALAGGFQTELIERPEARRIAESNLENLLFNPLPGFQDCPWGRSPAIVPVIQAAALFRFPSEPGPGIERGRRAAPFSAQPPQEGTLIGSASTISGGRVDIRLTSEARLRHCYLAGATGSGKTSLMLSAALQDIADGHGACVIDPHGHNLYSRVLANIPEARRKDVINFDCSRPDPGWSFNMLQHSSEGERDRIVENFLEIFGQLFDLKTTGGPIFEMYFRTALTLVMSDPKATLADFMKFYQDKDYRSYCISLCKDPFVCATWERTVNSAGGEMSLSNVAPYIVSKLSPFLFNRQIRAIVSAKETTLDFSALVRDRKILVVNLAKGSLGPLASSFVGMLFIEKILRAAMNPANTPKGDRNFYLYLDEFQNLATAGTAEMLAEARKYRVGVMAANQCLGQLPMNVLKAILGNAGNILSFRVGPQDAELLEEYFQPTFSKADLISLPVGAAAASIVSTAGDKPAPFYLSTANGLAVTIPAVPCQAEADADEKPPAKAVKTGKRRCPSPRKTKDAPEQDSSGIKKA